MQVPVSNESQAVPVRVNGEETTPRTDTLNAQDRCDSCGAQAYLAVYYETAESALLFCAHHFTRWEPKIREKASALVDERWKLTEALKKEFYN